VRAEHVALDVRLLAFTFALRLPPFLFSIRRRCTRAHIAQQRCTSRRIRVGAGSRFTRDGLVVLQIARGRTAVPPA